MPITLRNALASTSKTTRRVIIGLLAALVLLAVGNDLWHRYTERQLVEEKQKLELENKEKTDQLNEANGRASAFELSAREERSKSDALKEVIATGNKNIQYVVRQQDRTRESYEKAKADLSDCGNLDDCIRSTCAELALTGFATPDCDGYTPKVP